MAVDLNECPLCGLPSESSKEAYDHIDRDHRINPERDLPWIEEYNARVYACRACPLGYSRLRPAILRGYWTAKVAFVGESPGEQEDREGLPFVGPAGQYVEQLIRCLPLGKGEWCCLNIIKCHPPGNQVLTAHIRACNHFFWEQIDRINPKLIVTLGWRCFSTIFPGVEWQEWQGRVMKRSQLDGYRRYFAMVHPASQFYESSKALVWRHQCDVLFDVVAKLVEDNQSVG